MNIQPVAFIDSWAFASALYARYKDRFTGESAAFLPLRSADGPLPILAEWKSAKALLSRIRTAAAPFMGGSLPELREAALVRVAPGGFIPWQADIDRKAKSLHLCIVPSPGAWVYSGGEGAVLPAGQLTYVNKRVLWSAVNLGEYPVTHLVVDVRAPDAED